MTAELGVSAPLDFEAFFTGSSPGMLSRALLICGSRQDAEDAIQHAYAEAFRRWGRIAGYDAPDAWVYRVVKQRLWAAARRRGRTRPAGLDVSAQPAGTPEQGARARAVLAALAALPRRQRELIVLHALHGMTEREIAAELGITRGGVAAGISKGRRNLRKALGMGEHEAATEDFSLTTSRPACLDADDLSSTLRETEAWMRAGVAADSAMLRRLRTELDGRC